MMAVLMRNTGVQPGLPCCACSPTCRELEGHHPRWYLLLALKLCRMSTHMNARPGLHRECFDSALNVEGRVTCNLLEPCMRTDSVACWLSMCT